MYNITCVCIRCNGQKNHNTVNIVEEQINAAVYIAYTPCMNIPFIIMVTCQFTCSHISHYTSLHTHGRFLCNVEQYL